MIIDLKAAACTALAGALAWLVWTFSPTLITRLGIGDLELLARLGAVVLSVSAMEAAFTRLLAHAPDA